MGTHCTLLVGGEQHQHFIPKEVNMGLDANAGFQKPMPADNVEPIDMGDRYDYKQEEIFQNIKLIGVLW